MRFSCFSDFQSTLNTYTIRKHSLGTANPMTMLDLSVLLLEKHRNTHRPCWPCSWGWLCNSVWQRRQKQKEVCWGSSQLFTKGTVKKVALAISSFFWLHGRHNAWGVAVTFPLKAMSKITKLPMCQRWPSRQIKGTGSLPASWICCNNDSPSSRLVLTKSYLSRCEVFCYIHSYSIPKKYILIVSSRS